MSKELLKKSVLDAGSGSYAWSLYFFKMDWRSRNPYIVHKIRFKNADSLQMYARGLTEAVGRYQLEKVEKVQLYTGENSKVACDKISLKDDLLREEWGYLFQDIAEASDQKISGKYNGYILTGTPNEWEKPSLTLIKMANPVIAMNKQKSIAFRFTGEDELDLMSDDICRLYMDVDMIVIGDWLYAFNLRVETLFNMEKTMKKIKEQSIECMLKTNAFSDGETFVKLARSYTSSRTFVTLDRDRMRKLESRQGRRAVAELLELETDNQGRISVADKEEASLLIRYICFKIFKDYETEGLLEASNVTKVTRG